MSDAAVLPDKLRAPALAFARWTALLMGWVWLGQQGQRFAWSLASGLIAVAFWWALRLVLLRWPIWRKSPPSLVAVMLWGSVTAFGVGVLSRLEAGPVSFGLLMVIALSWAVWSAALDAQAPASPQCQRPWVGWPPVFAALMTWGTLSLNGIPGERGVVVAGVLLVVALLAWSGVPVARTAPRRAANGLPQTAMGLMMGSLGLSSAWCASAGWSTTTVTGVHLLLMATLPGLVRLEWVPRQMPTLVSRILPLALVMVGGSVLWMALSLASGLVGMLLLALAWALPNPGGEAPKTHWVGAAWRWAPLGGPLLLVAVGVWSPALGPQALALAYGGVGALAGLMVLWRLAAERWVHRVGDPAVWVPSEEV